MSRLLVTNDDGIDAVGLHVLARALVDAGHDVLVVAPARQFSGASAAVLIDDPVDGSEEGGGPSIRVERRELDGVPTAWAVGASPAICVHLGLRGALGPVPDAVLSGINPGANTGRVLLHSGTVGAAMTAAVAGIPAIAVSLDELDDRVPHRYGPAADAALRLLPLALAQPAGTLLNLNVPNTGGPHPLAEAPLDPVGIVHTTSPDAEADDLSIAVRLDGGAEPEAGSDVALLRSGSATVTAVVPPRAVPIEGPLPR